MQILCYKRKCVCVCVFVFVCVYLLASLLALKVEACHGGSRADNLRCYVEIKCHLVAADDFYCRSYCLLYPSTIAVQSPSSLSLILTTFTLISLKLSTTGEQQRRFVVVLTVHRR